MQQLYNARYRAKNLEQIRRKDREAKRSRRQRLKDESLSKDLPMGEFACHDSFDLYILRYDFDPCHTMGCKIGRSQNVLIRARQLAEGHCFELKILRVYTGCGHLEPLVHKLLAGKRCTGGFSREWFDVSFDTAMLAIRLAKELYDPLCALSDGESCSAQEENEPCTTTTTLV
jgi:hypothetical protein